MSPVRHDPSRSRLALRALLGVALLPGTSAAQSNVCERPQRWSGRVCALEQGSVPYVEPVSTAIVVKATAERRLNMAPLPIVGAQTVGMFLRVHTNSSSGRAVAGILDLQELMDESEEVFNVASAQCRHGATDACMSALQEVAPNVDPDDLSAATLWGHGCVSASDRVERNFPQVGLERSELPYEAPRYFAIAYVEGDSQAQLDLTLTRNEQRLSEYRIVCGALQRGSVRLPAQGGYQEQLQLGTVMVDVRPSSGGPLSGIHFRGESLPPRMLGDAALSSGTLGQSSELTYTGDVATCTVQPPPEPGPGPLPILQPE